jgi:hypothetical protein
LFSVAFGELIPDSASHDTGIHSEVLVESLLEIPKHTTGLCMMVDMLKELAITHNGSFQTTGLSEA